MSKARARHDAVVFLAALRAHSSILCQRCAFGLRVAQQTILGFWQRK